MGEMLNEYAQYANTLDYDDCGKKLLCKLAGKKKGKLSSCFFTFKNNTFYSEIFILVTNLDTNEQGRPC